jgi:hypothetical protein
MTARAHCGISRSPSELPKADRAANEIHFRQSEQLRLAVA